MIVARFAEQKDLSFILEEINNSDIARHVNDDLTIENVISDSQIALKSFLVIDEDEKPKGFFYFQNLNSITIDIHTCIRGVRSKLIAGAKAIDLFRDNGVEVIISFIPAYNLAALKYAKFLGFEESGRIKKSYLFNGEAIDQVIVSKNIKGD